MLTDALEMGIRRTYICKEFWDILDSSIGAGPFDGACLVCAQALKDAAGEGDIVRIVDTSTNTTHHYGLRIGGTVYDFDGACDSRTWIQRFARNENLTSRPLSVETGIVESAGIADDDNVRREVARLLSSRMEAVSYRLAS